MNFTDYKFPCKDVVNLLATSRRNLIPTDKQIEKAVAALNKESLLGLTETDIGNILIAVHGYAERSTQRLSPTVIKYLCEVYSMEKYGIGPIIKFEERSNRSYQINGTKSEALAVEILSRYDKVKYEKNQILFENKYFVGKPDIIHKDSVKEIKILSGLPDFMLLLNSKPSKSDQYQLQCYMDLASCESGEIIYVATGICPEERESYLTYGKSMYINQHIEPEKIDKRLKKALLNCNFDSIPDSARIKKFPYKKNPDMIRFAKTKATAARNWLIKWDEKYNAIEKTTETHQ